MTERRRIWITGIGIITAIGTGRDAFRAGLRAARSPVRRIRRCISRPQLGCDGSNDKSLNGIAISTENPSAVRFALPDQIVFQVSR